MTVHSYDSVVTALESFAHTHRGRFPVVDENGQLVGMLTKGDITSGTLKALQRDYQAEEVRRYRVSHLIYCYNRRQLYKHLYPAYPAYIKDFLDPLF